LPVVTVLEALDVPVVVDVAVVVAEVVSVKLSVADNVDVAVALMEVVPVDVNVDVAVVLVNSVEVCVLLPLEDTVDTRVDVGLPEFVVEADDVAEADLVEVADVVTVLAALADFEDVAVLLIDETTVLVALDVAVED
jgi:hypothetical protein